MSFESKRPLTTFTALAVVAGADRLPYGLKVLENLLRNEDGHLVTATQIESLTKWKPDAVPQHEVQFTPARVLMQDFTAMRGGPRGHTPVAGRNTYSLEARWRHILSGRWMMEATNESV